MTRPTDSVQYDYINHDLTNTDEVLWAEDSAVSLFSSTSLDTTAAGGFDVGFGASVGLGAGVGVGFDAGVGLGATVGFGAITGCDGVLPGYQNEYITLLAHTKRFFSRFQRRQVHQ